MKKSYQNKNYWSRYDPEKSEKVYKVFHISKTFFNFIGNFNTYSVNHTQFIYFCTPD